MDVMMSFKNTFKTLIIFALLLPAVLFAAPVKLTGLSVVTAANNVRLVFSLSGPFKYRCSALLKPPRLVVDFTGVQLATTLSTANFSKTPIKSVQAIGSKKTSLSVTFELKKPYDFRPFVLRPYGQFGNRLAIDLLPVASKRFIQNTEAELEQKDILSNMPKAAAASTPPPAVIPRVPVKVLGQGKPLRDVVIVIDPGHGGKDPGATGKLGTHEKNVVLAISKDLYALLKKQPGVRPVLTRNGDYFITLRQRLRLARKGSTDMFIAIHADAYKDTVARGASVFALSSRGASSEAARWLAQKENYSELMGGTDLADKSDAVRSVLIDLSQTATISESVQVGNMIKNALGRVARLHRGFVEQAPFVVLKSPDIPSLLVETGFLSNRQEELLLRDPAYQRRVAAAMLSGIMGYLQNNPPMGTTFAARQQLLKIS